MQWSDLLKSEKPADVVQNSGDMFFFRLDSNGGLSSQRVCENCWGNIPRYRDFPYGLTSPDSDGDAGGNFAKTRKTAAEGLEAREALRMAVCLPCYFEAFQQVYPGATLPDLSGELMVA